MKMTLGFFVLRRHMNHSWRRTRARWSLSFFFLHEFNTIATSFQRPMTIVVPSHSGLPKRLPAAGDGRTETQLCVSVPFFWWLNKIHTLRVDLLEEGRRCHRAVQPVGPRQRERRPARRGKCRTDTPVKTSASGGLVDHLPVLTIDETNSLFHLLITAPLLFAFILIVKRKYWLELLNVQICCCFFPYLSLLTVNGDLLDSDCWTKGVIKRCYFGLFWDMNISLFFFFFIWCHLEIHQEWRRDIWNSVMPWDNTVF